MASTKMNYDQSTGGTIIKDSRPSDTASIIEKKGFEISREDLQKHIQDFLDAGGTPETIVIDPEESVYEEYMPYIQRQ